MPKTRSPLTIKAQSISGVTWKWHVLNHAATAILEVAVHKGFKALDTVPHVLTALVVTDLAAMQVVHPPEIPNPNWLMPDISGAGQRAFGDDLLARHKFVLLPSAVLAHSWNLVFVSMRAAGAYAFVSQEVFALDTRLHPALPCLLIAG